MIYIIEPDRILGAQYKQALASAGYGKIELFSTASAGIKALETAIPDLVILELALPGHNGFEFLYELISYSDTADVKVIINSTLTDTEVPWGYVRAQDVCIIGHLHKPSSSLDELLRIVKESLL
jgi:two-component system, OmpR family, alkaline phosphatase synthesis response regulator PhoP